QALARPGRSRLPELQRPVTHLPARSQLDCGSRGSCTPKAKDQPDTRQGIDGNGTTSHDVSPSAPPGDGQRQTVRRPSARFIQQPLSLILGPKREPPIPEVFDAR